MKRDSALISIIVPIYNVEKFVEKCILSIINQTYTNLQIILVDDGSTDCSGKICDDYEKKDHRIQVIHQENSGLVCARKEGLKRARGAYVGFVDGDDYIDNTMYDDMLQDMLLFQADFIHTDYFDERKDSKRKEIARESKICDIRENKIQFLCDCVLNQHVNTSISYSIWSKLFRRELILKCYQKVPDSQSFGEDMLALCVCVMESNYIYIERKKYYHYVYRNDSMTHIDWTQMIVNLAKLYQCLQTLFEDYDSNDILKNSLDKWFQINIINNVSSKKLVHFNIHRYFYPDILSLEGKRVVLYGAGTIGQDYYAQFCKFRKCEIVAWVDKDYLKYKKHDTYVVGPDKIKEFDYEILIIAVKRYETAEQIKVELTGQDIPEDRIVWLQPEYLSY